MNNSISKKNYRIKNESIFKIKNDGGGANAWNDKYINAKNIIDQLNANINDFFINIDQIYIFNIIYESSCLPSKTNRIDFRREIKSKEYIPLKDISFDIENDVENCCLTYEIEKKEFEEFISLVESLSFLEITEEKWNINKGYIGFINTSQKDLIKKLSIIKNIEKPANFRFDKEDIPSKIYVEFIPLSINLKEFIFDKAGVEINLNSINKTKFIAFVSHAELKQINIHIPWIIKDVYQENKMLFYNPYNDILTKEIIFNKELEEIINKKKDFKLTNIKNTTIGVIDTAGNMPDSLNSCFIMESHKLDGGISDFNHGSIVSSLIIANDELGNSKDFLGNYKVKLFELLSKANEESPASVSYEHLVEKINLIIKNNYKNIKIWNLSLGFQKKINDFKVSPLASFLDYLSNEYDVLFIVASGNNGNDGICSPSDAFNVISVGSVTKDKNNHIKKSSYSSIGTTILYVKPEVSHFGGIYNYDGNKLLAYNGKKIVCNIEGTSFAAPKVCRMAAFLLEKGLSILEIKAHIINTSLSEEFEEKSSLFGYLIEPEFNNNYLTIKTEINDKDPRMIEIDFEGVENVSISISNNAIPINKISDEYSIDDFSFLIKKRKKNEENINSFLGLKDNNIENVKFDKKNMNKFKSEKELRINDSKYFTSKKEKILFKEEFDPDYNYYLFIKRLSLYSFPDSNVLSNALSIGISIIFNGSNLNFEKFIEKNSNIIQEIEVDIDIET